MFHSSDGGMTWEIFNEALEFKPILALAMNEQTCTLYAGAYDGSILRSTLDETHWQMTSVTVPTYLVQFCISS